MQLYYCSITMRLINRRFVHKLFVKLPIEGQDQNYRVYEIITATNINDYFRITNVGELYYKKTIKYGWALWHIVFGERIAICDITVWGWWIVIEAA